MRYLVFSSALVGALVVEWISFVKTGLLDRVMSAPYQAFIDILVKLLASGNSVDFLLCLGSLAVATASATVFFSMCFLIAYQVARIVSDPLA